MKKAHLYPFIEDVKHSLECLEAECDEIGADYQAIVQAIIEGEI